MDQQRLLATDDDAFESALRAEIDDAISYNDEYLAPARIAATLYYKGAPFGTEEDGRSKVIMPVVRDTVRATLPGLMRIFFGSLRVLEFLPSARMSDLDAEDATETVNYVVTRLNPGWRIFRDAFKDALIRKTGWFKWWFDDSQCVTITEFSGVSEEQLLEAQETLEPSEELQIVSAEQVGVTDPEQVGVDPVTGAPIVASPQPIIAYTVRITKRGPHNKVRVAAVPPDEVLLDRNARSEVDARIVIHRTFETRSALRARGVPEELLEDEGRQSTYEGQQGDEVSARLPGGSGTLNLNFAQGTRDQDLIPHFECYWRVDRDGDGYSELLQVCAVGQERKVYREKPVDEPPLAAICYDPEPHTATGFSQADSTMDLQLIESHVMRDVLDSLKASIFPRMGYVEGQASVDDILNTEIGAAIRMRTAGAVQPFEIPFSGEKAFPIFEKLEQTKESRTGIGRAAMALDGKALQSTTPDAARQALSAAQSQVELLAREFAQTGVARMFRGVLKLLTTHQNSEMQFMLNGKPLSVNPAQWDPDLEVAVNAGLGTSSSDQKIAVLSMVGEEQKEVLLTLGENNPLCSLQEFYNTKVRLLELAGFRDVHKFWRNPQQAMDEGASLPEPQPTPEQVLAAAQVEIEKSKLEADTLKTILEDDRKRDEFEADVILRAAEIKAKYNTQVDTLAIKTMIERERSDRREGEMALKESLSKQQAPAPSITVNTPKPRRVMKTPMRDESGRIVAIEEKEID